MRDVLNEELELLSSLACSDDVRVANYHDDPRFSTEDFADTDHMTPEAAVRFTRILDQEFITPILSMLANSPTLASRTTDGERAGMAALD